MKIVSLSVQIVWSVIPTLMLLSGIALIICGFGIPMLFWVGCCLIVSAIFGYTIPVIINHLANIEHNTEQTQKCLESIDKHICKIGQYQCDILYEIHRNIS